MTRKLLRHHKQIHWYHLGKLSVCFVIIFLFCLFVKIYHLQHSSVTWSLVRFWYTLIAIHIHAADMASFSQHKMISLYLYRIDSYFALALYCFSFSFCFCSFCEIDTVRSAMGQDSMRSVGCGCIVRSQSSFSERASACVTCVCRDADHLPSVGPDSMPIDWFSNCLYPERGFNHNTCRRGTRLVHS